MKILLIYTGGTIGMVRDADSGTYIPFDFQNLESQIPQINQLDCELDVKSYEPSIDEIFLTVDNGQYQRLIFFG